MFSKLCHREPGHIDLKSLKKCICDFTDLGSLQLKGGMKVLMF